VINLGPILHRLATIHPLHRTTDDDERQPCETLTALLSSGALWLEPAFPAWRNHTGWSVTTTSGLTVWHCCHGTLGAAPLIGRHSGRHSGKRLSAAECHHQCQCCWDCSCQKKETSRPTAHSAAPTTFFPVSLKQLDPWVSAPRSSWHKSKGVWPRWRQTLVKRRSFSSACRSPSNASTRHA